MIFQIISAAGKEFFSLFIYGISLLVEKFFPFQTVSRKEFAGRIGQRVKL
jgi:hypothetical protein